MKSRWVAMILNLIFPGSGYIYIKKSFRSTVIGLVMLITTILTYLIYTYEVLLSAIPIWAITLLYILGLILAIDVYLDANHC